MYCDTYLSLDQCCHLSLTILIVGKFFFGTFNDKISSLFSARIYGLNLTSRTGLNFDLAKYNQSDRAKFNP